MVYLLHACKKQKNKAEEGDKELARARRREIERSTKEEK
jgi:phage-related protein